MSSAGEQIFSPLRVCNEHENPSYVTVSKRKENLNQNKN